MRKKIRNLKIKYDSGDFQDLLNNLADWVDPDNKSRSGGSEETLEEGKYPLNRSFLVLEEIKKTPGMTEEIYRVLKPHITVYGIKGLNINYVGKDVLLALDLSEDLVRDILSRIQRGGEFYKPFVDLKSFCTYLSERGSPLCANLEERFETLNMLKFNTALHFRIQGERTIS